MSLPNCSRCGHPADWHRHDDADPTPPTDPACPFRCLGYDCMAPGPPPAENPCGCPNYEGEHDHRCRSCGARLECFAPDEDATCPEDPAEPGMCEPCYTARREQADAGGRG